VEGHVKSLVAGGGERVTGLEFLFSLCVDRKRNGWGGREEAARFEQGRYWGYGPSAEGFPWGKVTVKVGIKSERWKEAEMGLSLGQKKSSLY